MKFVKYGITLRRITLDDIEIIRHWRNSDEIQKRMQYREYITKRMQKKWFYSIDNINNFYYLIEFKGEKIGLFNEKNIDWKNRTSETGLFIADEKYINTQIPILASLCLSEIGFYVIQGEKSFIRILKDNKQAIEYSLNFGYELCANQADNDPQLYVLTKQNFESKGKRLLDAANKAYKQDSTLMMYLEKDDYKSGIAQFIEKLIEQSTVKIPFETYNGGRRYHYP
jgi:RimJ/RimL family protein N-acetyltransferase